MSELHFNYLRLMEQNQARAWSEIFGSLLQVMSTALPLEEAQSLMTSAGLHLSRSLKMPVGLSVEDGEGRLNQMLADKGLGFVKLVSGEDDMVIRHFGFPTLIGAKTDSETDLTCAFIGGLHYGLFTSIGLDTSAEVFVVMSKDDPLTAEIRFSV